MSHLFKKKHLFRLVIFFVLIFLVGGIGGVFFENYVIPRIRTNQTLSRLDIFRKAGEKITVINKTEQITVGEDDSINRIASKAANSVVNILSVVDKSEAITKQKIVPESEDKKESLSGTGTIITSDGLIVTYRGSIIEENASYFVLLPNGTYYEGTLVAVDEFSNLAYIRIETSNLSSISLANSDEAYPGKKLVAIGNSFGEYQNRFSAGLLSNVNKIFNLDGKTVSSTEKLEGVFETDFNDQKEYLGGPVINYNGELVGIIGSLSIDGKDKYFQIPSNALKSSMERVISGQADSRPIFGLYYVPITKEYSLVHGLDRDRGAHVYLPSGKQGLAIISGSSAEKAGIMMNDIIIAANGQEINLGNPLSNVINKLKKGDKLNLLILRDGKEIEISADL